MAQQVGYGLQVDYARLARTREALRAFGPEALAAVDNDIRAAGREVTDEASARVRALATSHGRRDTAAGYRTRVTARGVRIEGKGRGGAIIEFAGAKNPRGATAQGRSLIATLSRRYGKPGRLLWAAWDKRSGQVNARITTTTEAAERRLQASIDGI